MAWETRRGKGRYYTRSRRIGGRVVREYMGSGPDAELIAQIDELDRQQREIGIEERRQRQAAADAVATALTQFGALTEATVADALEAAGYHQHKGQWRRSRKR